MHGPLRRRIVQRLPVTGARNGGKVETMIPRIPPPPPSDENAGPGRSVDLVGELAVRRGLISPAMLHEALDLQFATGCRVGDAMLQLGHLEDGQLAQLLAEALRLPYASVATVAFTPEQLNEIPEAVARKHTVLP